MSETQDPLGSASSRHAGERWELAQRVAASPLFERSKRLRDFLLYVSESALKGNVEGVNEQRVGQAVFGRAQQYNPAVDNIVRVEARNLRTKLATYFETVGMDEPIVIRIPKGSYLPVFEPRSSALNQSGILEEPALGEAAAGLETTSIAEPDTRPRPKLSRAMFFAGLATLFAAAAAWLTYQNINLNRHLVPVEDWPRESRLTVRDLPWAAVFDRSRQTTVVLADSCLAFFTDITRRTVHLNDYISRDYLREGELPKELRPILPLFVSRQYTSVADAGLVGQIVYLGRNFHDRLTIKYARNMEVRNFKHDHLIVLGTTRANPWVELFEPHMNFRFQYDRAAGNGVIQNMQPLPGEQREYVTSNLPGNENYSIIALLPNLENSGNVLIIEGITMEGTEAAGDFLVNPEFGSKVLPRLRRKQGALATYFELLVKSRKIGGTAIDSEVVSLRIHE